MAFWAAVTLNFNGSRTLFNQPCLNAANQRVGELALKRRGTRRNRISEQQLRAMQDTNQSVALRQGSNFIERNAVHRCPGRHGIHALAVGQR
jgi:hypothetical protein